MVSLKLLRPFLGVCPLLQNPVRDLEFTVNSHRTRSIRLLVQIYVAVPGAVVGTVAC